MSLITLTFGEGRGNQSEIEIVAPQDNIQIYPWEKNKLCIKKVSRFFGDPEIYVVGEIVSGQVSKGMKGELNGKSFTVKDLNCKYHRTSSAKRGMTVGLSIEGVSAEELEKGSLISFS